MVFHSNVILVVGKCVLTLLGLFFIYKSWYTDTNSCRKMVRTGRWSHDVVTLPRYSQWQSFNCMTSDYDREPIETCLANQSLFFVGDSVTRQVFWYVASRVDQQYALELKHTVDKHSHIRFDHGQIHLKFIWDPFLNGTDVHRLVTASDTRTDADTGENSGDTSNDLSCAGVVLSSGLWHVKHDGVALQSTYKSMLDRVTNHTNSINDFARGKPPVIMLPPPGIVYNQLSADRVVNITESRIKEVLEMLESVDGMAGPEVLWSLHDLTSVSPATMQLDGVHMGPKAVHAATNLVLNRICNERILKGSKKALSTCCSSSLPHIAGLVGLSPVFALLVVPYITSRDVHLRQHHDDFLTSTLLFLAICVSCWLTDRTTIFSKITKPVSEYSFVIVTVASMIASVLRIDRTHSVGGYKTGRSPTATATRSSFLSREQTEEWKGWMQIVTLFYHYFGMSKVLWVYKTVRLLVASYLFLTGYGHASYFLRSQDFSLRRSTTVFVRLNLLAFGLSWIMDNNYDFYYFPGLASLWYLITYATLWNKSKTIISTQRFVLRVLASALVSRTVLDMGKVITHVFTATGVMGGPAINAKEFVFRVKLDLYTPYLGMLLALVVERYGTTISDRLMRWQTSHQQIAKTIIIHITWISLVLLYCVIGSQQHDKFGSNMVHPYISIFPIAAYIILRNSHAALREYHFPILAKIGRISLETYVLQYHLWLAADTKGLLRLGMFDVRSYTSTSTVSSWAFWVEGTVITAVFLWISSICADVVGQITLWYVSAPESNKQRKLTGMVVLVMWLPNFVHRLVRA